MQRFAQVLQDAGIVTTVRKTRGDDIDAACGQLAGEVQDRTHRCENASVGAPDSNPRTGERMSPSRRCTIAPLLLTVLMLGIGACTTTTTTTSGPPSASGDRHGFR